MKPFQYYLLSNTTYWSTHTRKRNRRWMKGDAGKIRGSNLGPNQGSKFHTLQSSSTWAIQVLLLLSSLSLAEAHWGHCGFSEASGQSVLLETFFSSIPPGEFKALGWPSWDQGGWVISRGYSSCNSLFRARWLHPLIATHTVSPSSVHFCQLWGP